MRYLSRALSLCLLLAIGCAHAEAPRRAPATRPGPYWNLYLPGISGWRGLDRRTIEGLTDAGLGDFDHYDWTTADPGLGSLLNRTRARAEAEKVRKLILDRRAADPAAKITLVAHSAGAGITAWALEGLPAGVLVDRIVLIQPALSPSYDLTPMLKHVAARVDVFYSQHDNVVLGAGTKLFGTIDGVHTEAAGMKGFTRPPSADEQQYLKLVQHPYTKDWLKFDNIGDHIGPMNAEFAREVIAPLVLGDLVPATQPLERPVDASTSAEDSSR